LNWQEKTIIELMNLGVDDIDIYNPRRYNWPSEDNHKEIEYQIKWEQEHLDKSDLIVMILLIILMFWALISFGKYLISFF
jgi:hypothetical protein